MYTDVKLNLESVHCAGRAIKPSLRGCNYLYEYFHGINNRYRISCHSEPESEPIATLQIVEFLTILKSEAPEAKV